MIVKSLSLFIIMIDLVKVLEEFDLIEGCLFYLMSI